MERRSEMRITVLGVLLLVGSILLVVFIVNQLRVDPTANKAKIDEQPNQHNY